MDTAARAARRLRWAQTVGALSRGMEWQATRALARCWRHDCRWQATRSAECDESALAAQDQEAPDELVGRQRHRLVAAWSIDPIVLVPEGDAVVVGSYEATIGDGHAVGVAREITQDLPGACERLSCVDHPLDLAQRF